MKKKQRGKLTNKKWALIFIGICAAALLMELILVICVLKKDPNPKDKIEKVRMYEVLRIQEENKNGEIRKYTYDLFGRIASIERQFDALNRAVDEYRYYDDSSMTPIEITEITYRGENERRRKEISYSEPSPYRDMEAVCDGDVKPVVFRNDLGRIRSITLNLPGGEIVRFYYEFDELGRISERRDYRVCYDGGYWAAPSEYQLKALIYQYDENGFLSYVKISRFETGALILNWNEVHYRYDQNGYVISKEYSEDGAAFGTETFSYDQNGLLTKISFTSQTGETVTTMERTYQIMEVSEEYLTESDRLRVNKPEDWIRRNQEEAVDPYSVGAAPGAYK